MSRARRRGACSLRRGDRKLVDGEREACGGVVASSGTGSAPSTTAFRGTPEVHPCGSGAAVPGRTRPLNAVVEDALPFAASITGAGGFDYWRWQFRLPVLTASTGGVGDFDGRPWVNAGSRGWQLGGRGEPGGRR